MVTPFIGSTLGRRFLGYIDCEDERLEELLNRSSRLVVRDAFVESFDEDTITNLGDGEIDRSILYAVEAPDQQRVGDRPAPDAARQRLQMQLGPYAALGLLRKASGQKLLPNGKGPMIRLSDATLGYSTRGQMMLRDVGSLIVNREKLDWVRACEGDAPAFPGVPVVTDSE